MKKTCKTPTGWRDQHVGEERAHPSFNFVRVIACTGCNKIMRWLPC